MIKTAILLLSLFCIAECHGGSPYDPLRVLQKSRARSRKSSQQYTQLTQDVLKSTQYSPVYMASQNGLKEADMIDSLPGQPPVGFSQYSGYVTVDPSAGRALFYYFAEAEDASTKPLVLWLNGGPGCSSLGAGAMTELGPFRVNPDGKTLWYNKYAWNRVANVVFLESPAGVGFSYSNRSSDYVTGDSKMAADAYTFLVNWLERFPEYKTRDFYITGESYAGHYVPQLADLVLQNNKVTNQTVINLKGIAIGNAYIDYTDRWAGTYDHFWTSALISDETHQGILDNCNFTSDATVSDVCDDYQDKAFEESGNVYIYDIYAPLCGSASTAPSLSSYDPCSDVYATTYLNSPQVQKALHANITALPGPWALCNDPIFDSWNDSPLTVLPVIQKLMASGIRVWIYSGDTDGIIPVTTTRYSMPKLGAPLKTPWYPWDFQGEVGGFVVGYENVTFVSIRGAGHFVPGYQPQRALAFFSSFLQGKLPSPQKN
ncbi:serine carboxypeptidase 1-like [Salvia hispanica]|uniref:serine carboxypeptidase 1-like n=1 Tax=Salvia hispanica TaxID=49212 RepID=UPI00200972C1|nr:serine carboxypeptidase 1-like [Salvia hispanica]